MTKRHTKQNNKQALGQYFTTKSNEILAGWEYIVKNKHVVDPFAGGHDLLNWSESHGSLSTIGYDIEPNAISVHNDSLLNPVNMKGKILITNPPYLSKNKSKGQYAQIFSKWNQSDLYKCFLASLITSDCDEGIVIIPSNFFCESRPAARKIFFKNYSIISAKYWSIPVFEDATTGITAFHFQRGGNNIQTFPMTFFPENEVKEVVLKKQYDYLWGEEFFALLPTSSYDIIKTDIGMKAPNTNLVLGLLDKGKYPQGLSFNEHEPIYCKPKSFTTYQLTICDMSLDSDRQREIIAIFNSVLSKYRKQYKGMFLANYMGANQKILSRRFCHLLVSYAISQTATNLVEF